MGFGPFTGTVSVRLPECQALRRRHACCCPFPVSAPCSERSPLGCHRKPSRIRTYLLPGAAGTALAGMAATACLAPQAMADPLPAHTGAQPAAVTDTASYAGISLADLLSTVKRSSGHKVQAQPVSYTVRSGDSLSSIAGRFYHKQSDWPVLYWANHSKIRWANVVSAGQVLRIPAEPAKIPGAPAQLGPAAPAPAAPAATAATAATGSPAYAPAQAAAP